MMTVQELIDQLSQLDPNTLIMIDGYEGGISEIKSIDDAPIVLNYNSEPWYGPHEYLENTDHKEPNAYTYIIKR